MKIGRYIKKGTHIELTKISEKALKILYCECRQIVRAGFSQSDAAELNGQNVYNLLAFSDWLCVDIEFAIDEFRNNKFFISKCARGYFLDN